MNLRDRVSLSMSMAGQMAVYVGQKDGGDFHRVLVPVMYFNHPLFEKLLREAEEEYGFDHPGGITIPCRISEFESVQTRIVAGRGRQKLMTRKMTSIRRGKLLVTPLMLDDSMLWVSSLISVCVSCPSLLQTWCSTKCPRGILGLLRRGGEEE
ncbi:uncharacterized protein LOC114291825 [Camellia sinensis]|uniref:uncharacterized protein LOC114291825 n=1 Tax=Camellia sinensis TaxID=4442 RepID=UPI001036418C|nr:uncharacterized protein LOC114291825 [Camellia sinensis]